MKFEIKSKTILPSEYQVLSKWVSKSLKFYDERITYRKLAKEAGLEAAGFFNNQTEKNCKEFLAQTDPCGFDRDTKTSVGLVKNPMENTRLTEDTTYLKKSDCMKLKTKNTTHAMGSEIENEFYLYS